MYEKKIFGIPVSLINEIREEHAESVSDLVLQAATGKAQMADRAVGQVEEQVGNAQATLDALVFPEGEVEEPEEAGSLDSAAACAEASVAICARMEAVRSELAEFDTVIANLAHDIVTAKRDIKTLGPTTEMAKAFLTGESEGEGRGYDSALEAQEAWVDADSAIKNAEKTERKSSEIVTQKIEKIVDTLQAEEYGEIAPIQRRRILDSRKSMHLDAEEFALDAQNRLASVEYTLEDIHKRKDDIVDYLLDDVRATLSHLQALERHSTLPENNTSWAGWSGKPFFKVSVDKKRFEDGYGRNRIEDYLDSIINARSNAFSTSAQHIIQGAAKCALKDITRITTMKPDHFASTHSYTLEEAAVWSGGEGLTYAAIALMSFSKLASYINSTTQKGGNFLLVDNPIGTCNHLSFIKLQRLMSKLLNVQLIYPTAVRDHQALSMFPNFVALSHDRQDRKTGYTYIQVEEARGDWPSELLSSHMTIQKEFSDDI